MLRPPLRRRRRTTERESANCVGVVWVRMCVKSISDGTYIPPSDEMRLISLRRPDGPPGQGARPAEEGD